MTAMEGFVAVLKEQPYAAYDHFMNVWYRFTREELRDITQELLYAVYEKARIDEKRVLKYLAENLEEKYKDEER